MVVVGEIAVLSKALMDFYFTFKGEDAAREASELSFLVISKNDIDRTFDALCHNGKIMKFSWNDLKPIQKKKDA